MDYHFFQDSRIGGRTVNQDRVAHVRHGDDVLLVVADGMGGHARGELAAQIAVDALCEAFRAQQELGLRDPPGFLAGALAAAHAAIAEYARAFNLPDSPRTTCVACIVTAGTAYWIHAGDSRLYLLRDGQVRFVTRDHSKVQALLEAGAISAEQARHHPQRNMVFSCLGGHAPPNLERGPATALQPGDVLVLCTDGFWAELSPQEIAAFVHGQPLEEALARLMDNAEARAGGGDNLSAVALKLVEEGDD